MAELRKESFLLSYLSSEHPTLGLNKSQNETDLLGVVYSGVFFRGRPLG